MGYFIKNEKGERGFFPSKNKWVNMSIVALALATVIPPSIIAYHDYTRDVADYKAGKLKTEPDINDYSPLRSIERLLLDGDNSHNSR